MKIISRSDIGKMCHDAHARTKFVLQASIVICVYLLRKVLYAVETL
jgi:hypothetical protein